jgi:hypothetical protein
MHDGQKVSAEIGPNQGNESAAAMLTRSYWGSVALELSEECRTNAADCLRLSRQAYTLESQGYWLSMAEFWWKLAQHAEEREAIASVDPATVEAIPDSCAGKSN